MRERRRGRQLLVVRCFHLCNAPACAESTVLWLMSWPLHPRRLLRAAPFHARPDPPREAACCACCAALRAGGAPSVSIGASLRKAFPPAAHAELEEVLARLDSCFCAPSSAQRKEAAGAWKWGFGPSQLRGDAHWRPPNPHRAGRMARFLLEASAGGARGGACWGLLVGPGAHDGGWLPVRRLCCCCLLGHGPLCACDGGSARQVQSCPLRPAAFLQDAGVSTADALAALKIAPWVLGIDPDAQARPALAVLASFGFGGEVRAARLFCSRLVVPAVAVGCA